MQPSTVVVNVREKHLVLDMIRYIHHILLFTLHTSDTLDKIEQHKYEIIIKIQYINMIFIFIFLFQTIYNNILDCRPITHMS